MQARQLDRDTAIGATPATTKAKLTESEDDTDIRPATTTATIAPVRRTIIRIQTDRHTPQPADSPTNVQTTGQSDVYYAPQSTSQGTYPKIHIFNIYDRLACKNSTPHQKGIPSSIIASPASEHNHSPRIAQIALTNYPTTSCIIRIPAFSPQQGSPIHDEIPSQQGRYRQPDVAPSFSQPICFDHPLS